MKHARCALAIMVCAVMVGCNPIDVPASPPPTTTPIIVYHTADTQALINAIAVSEFALNFRAELHPEQQSYEMLLSQVSDDTIPFFVTHHNPTDAPETLSTLPLVQDGLAIIKHPDNTVTTLSRDDLQQIYRGFITDWRELGGNEATITLYTRPESSALRLEFDRLVMGQQRITPNAQILTSTEQMLARIADDESAIGYVPISSLQSTDVSFVIDGIAPTVEALSEQRYPLRMTIYAIGQDTEETIYRDLFIWVQNMSLDDFDAQFVPLLP